MSQSTNLERTIPIPYFSDLEGFEEEIEFLRKNVLTPYTNRKAHWKARIYDFPHGILFHGNCAGVKLLAKALENELKEIRKIEIQSKCFSNQYNQPSVNYLLLKYDKKVKSVSKLLKYEESLRFEYVYTRKCVNIATTDNLKNMPKKLRGLSWFQHIYPCVPQLSEQKKKTLIKYGIQPDSWKIEMHSCRKCVKCRQTILGSERFNNETTRDDSKSIVVQTMVYLTARITGL